MNFDLNTLITLLLIFGAINWGLVAYNGTDLVNKVTVATGNPMYEQYVKYAIGVAGSYALYQYVSHNI